MESSLLEELSTVKSGLAVFFDKSKVAGKTDTSVIDVLGTVTGVYGNSGSGSAVNILFVIETKVADGARLRFNINGLGKSTVSRSTVGNNSTRSLRAESGGRIVDTETSLVS